MRISDCSSDVCSSDLEVLAIILRPGRIVERGLPLVLGVLLARGLVGELTLLDGLVEQLVRRVIAGRDRGILRLVIGVVLHTTLVRSAERCVGKECVSTFRFRWAPKQ